MGVHVLSRRVMPDRIIKAVVAIKRGGNIMNDKSILDILEQIVNTCKLLSQEIYNNLDYSNNTINFCVNTFQELEFKIWELKEMV